MEDIVIKDGMDKSDAETTIDYKNEDVTKKKESKELSFENSNKLEAYSSEDKSSIVPSSVKLNSNNNSLNVMQFINTIEHIRLKETQYFTYEYEEVDEESELEEEIDAFLFVKENKNSEKFEKIIEFEKSSIGNPFIINNNSFTSKLLDKRLSAILDQLSMPNIMDNQSMTEDLMIKMFNHQINAFPNYRLNYKNWMVNNTELINQIFNLIDWNRFLKHVLSEVLTKIKMKMDSDFRSACRQKNPAIGIPMKRVVLHCQLFKSKKIYLINQYLSRTNK